MNGSIVRILVEAGQQVEAGAPLVVLEAMKMEHSIAPPTMAWSKPFTAVKAN
nr:biotin/lipoyl-containing protein [Pseudomonas sp. PDM24]